MKLRNNNPRDLLAKYENSTEFYGKCTSVRLPLEVARAIWRFGVNSGAKSESEAVVAALSDWLGKHVELREPMPLEGHLDVIAEKVKKTVLKELSRAL